ncbi:MAG: hypothetical protein CVU40_14065 [Chloroflexi bacterium HGW-Chloroflexi-2]|nr:MAG: hypothetical protein CVU40_14065 [Chloroflexi bacterium HGW-Chloroflexi-2]
MKYITPKRLMFTGFLCVLMGVVFPFLMVMQVLESTFFLNFFSFTISLIGIIIGVIGSAYYFRINRRDR